MKRLLSLVLLCATMFVMGTVMAQAPQRVSYQAVVRHANNHIAANETMDVRISILQGSADGHVIYVESRRVSTNANGLFTLVVGNGDPLSGMNFSNINWAEGPYFLKSEVDADGDQTYSAVSVSQILSVPYALHANTASNLIGMTDSLNAIRTKVATDMQIGRIHTENAVNALSDEILALRTVIDDTVLFLTEYLDENVASINARIDEVEETIDTLNAEIREYIDDEIVTVNGTIEDLKEDVNSRIDDVEGDIDTLSNNVVEGFSNVESTFQALNADIDNRFDSAFAAINQTASDLTNAEIELTTAINTLGEKVDSIDDATNVSLQALRDAIDTNNAHDSINFAHLYNDIINTRNAHDEDMNDLRTFIDSIDHAKQDTIDRVAANLTAEVTARKKAVKRVNDSIDRVAANLATEVAAREVAEGKINDSIDHVAANLTAEVAAREVAEGKINDSIDHVAANLAAEVAAREVAEGKINDSIDHVAANLAAEVAARESLATLLNDTAAYMQDTINKVVANLAAEVAARESLATLLNDTAAYLQDTINKVAARIDAVVNTCCDSNWVLGRINDTVELIRNEFRPQNEQNSIEIEYLKQRADNLEAARTLDGVLTLGNDAGAKQIKNTANPTDAQDVTTKDYVDNLVHSYVDVLANLVDSLRNEISRLTGSLNRMNTYSDTMVYATADSVAAGFVVRGYTFTSFGVFNDTIGLNAAGFDTIVRIHLINVAEDFGDGTATGTMEHPYVISTQADLFAFYDIIASNNNVFDKKYVTLANDINVDAAWTPIVNFNGVFDGANHTITFSAGINADANGNVSFISVAQNATIKNLSIAGDITVVANSTSRFGAIAAQVKNGVIDNCHSHANLTLLNTGGACHVGGLVGAASSKYIVVSNSSADAAKLNVNVTTVANLGGLIGYSAVTDSIKIFNCSGNDTLIASGDKVYVGGLVGQQGNSTVKVIIDNCYAGGVLNVPTATTESFYGLLIGKNVSTVTTNIQYNYVNLYGIRNAGVGQNPAYMNSENIELGTTLPNNRVVYYKASGSKWVMLSGYVKDYTTTQETITIDATETSNPHTALVTRAQSKYGVAEANQWEADVVVLYGNVIMNKR